MFTFLNIHFNYFSSHKNIFSIKAISCLEIPRYLIIISLGGENLVSNLVNILIPPHTHTHLVWWLLKPSFQHLNSLKQFKHMMQLGAHSFSCCFPFTSNFMWLQASTSCLLKFSLHPLYFLQ